MHNFLCRSRQEPQNHLAQVLKICFVVSSMTVETTGGLTVTRICCKVSENSFKLKMEIKGESEKKKEKQVVKNGVAIETLAKDEAFWHSTLKNLSKELISEMKLSETNVSK